MFKRIATSLLLMAYVGSTFFLVGCNTVEGAGKDIQRGGQVIKDEANDVKDKM